MKRNVMIYIDCKDKTVGENICTLRKGWSNREAENTAQWRTS